MTEIILPGRTPNRVEPPRFSVLIPLFNKRAYFASTMELVLAQDFEDFEIVVVDDGSTDGSAAVVEAHPDPRVRLIRQTNAGPGPARNKAADHAAGEWLALLDADDLWAPDHLETLNRIIETCPQADVVSTRPLLVNTSELERRHATVRRGHIHTINFFSDRGEDRVNASTIAIRRSRFLESGGFGAFCPGEDTELWARLALHSQFAVSDDCTTIYVRDNDGVMDREERNFARTAARIVTPLEATLVRALEDHQYSSLHADITDYLDRLKLRDARIALFRGQCRQARSHLGALSRPKIAKSWHYRLLATLPSTLVRRFSLMYSAVKRRRTSITPLIGHGVHTRGDCS